MKRSLPAVHPWTLRAALSVLPTVAALGGGCGGTVPPPPPPATYADLALTEFHFGYAIPPDPGGSLWICLNRNPDGTDQDRGESVAVANVGHKDSPPYEIGVGITDEGGTGYVCRDRLTDTAGTPAGATDRWAGPWCCSLGLATVPAGSYHFFAMADVGKVVNDADRSNNVSIGSDRQQVP